MQNVFDQIKAHYTEFMCKYIRVFQRDVQVPGGPRCKGIIKDTKRSTHSSLPTTALPPLYLPFLSRKKETALREDRVSPSF
jgi:hypothetical protein